MSILGWIFFGLITGFIASKVVNSEGEGCFVDIALGFVGALVGGFVWRQLTGFNAFSFHFDLVSMLVAIFGAIVVLLIYHAVTGRRTLR
ncbi:MAG TPA: GlsB/YeaQ/YmgE family stress response membrane protein [Rhizomicrobium sp.]|nr:GlsB/YeaQ/YmgE family stress response membrane protein [Rhizomicrobium sp.]